MDDTEGTSLPYPINLLLLMAEHVSTLSIVIANHLDRFSRATMMQIRGHNIIAIMNIAVLHTPVPAIHGNNSLVVDDNRMIICSSSSMRWWTIMCFLVTAIVRKIRILKERVLV
jgi:hypothetical protein